MTTHSSLRKRSRNLCSLDSANRNEVPYDPQPWRITASGIFAELEPWVLHLSSELAERKYHCLVLLAFGFSGLGKTRVMTGDAAGGPFTLDTSVIGCTSKLLFKNKPREVGVVGRLIGTCTGEKNEIVVCTLEKGIATVAKLDGKLKEGRFRQALSHTKLGTHKDAMNFVQRCVKARRCRLTPRNLSGPSRSHQLIFFDFVAKGENGELLLDKDKGLIGTVVFSDLAGYEKGIFMFFRFSKVLSIIITIIIALIALLLARFIATHRLFQWSAPSKWLAERLSRRPDYFQDPWQFATALPGATFNLHGLTQWWQRTILH
ncbi:hypothetical protein J4E89_010695 [Alternaria sp. Ai002NY15]|nr:hypothetical protein J4E89_010695 [Alternaria sp. Ai002NY15]